ncbi:HD domain-containing protein, partial [bacterium]|nr:HD domain-containing protein [bacterium]
LVGYLSDEDLKRLESIARKEYIDIDSEKKNFLTPDEFENLSVRAGNLTSKEKQEIFSHVEKTIKILDKIPFPEYLANVPYLAGTHHEKLDGSGYPAGLNAEKLTYASRIIAVADYFEALVAFDRPYKPAKSIEEAKKIMMEEVRNRKLDPDIVNLLFEDEIFNCLQEKTRHPSPVK